MLRLKTGNWDRGPTEIDCAFQETLGIGRRFRYHWISHIDRVNTDNTALFPVFFICSTRIRRNSFRFGGILAQSHCNLAEIPFVDDILDSVQNDVEIWKRYAKNKNIRTILDICKNFLFARIASDGTSNGFTHISSKSLH